MIKQVDSLKSDKGKNNKVIDPKLGFMASKGGKLVYV